MTHFFSRRRGVASEPRWVANGVDVDPRIGCVRQNFGSGNVRTQDLQENFHGQNHPAPGDASHRSWIVSILSVCITMHLCCWAITRSLDHLTTFFETFYEFALLHFHNFFPTLPTLCICFIVCALMPHVMIPLHHHCHFHFVALSDSCIASLHDVPSS